MGIALFALNLRPVKGHLFFDWAVLGLDASLHSIKAGTLPHGAIVGRNSAGKAGYSFCPPHNSKRPEHLVVRIIALKHALTANQGFDEEKLYQEAEQEQIGEGLAGAGYFRR
jgi:phosphatidylethanolamine-binding protein (PEBP) family uncharacterized protein